MDKYEEVLEKYTLDLNDDEVSQKVAKIVEQWEENNTPDVLRFLYSCIDLTSLGSDDSKESIWKWIENVNAFDGSQPGISNVAAVCVYPNFVQTVKDTLRADVKIASVAGGFPSSQTLVEVKIAEVSLAVSDGADEIDIVLNCGEFLAHNWPEVCEEIEEIKNACRDARLKVILETGLLKKASTIKTAAILAMYSGADFIKTSTGKVYQGATPEAVFVICEAIREYYQLHEQMIGIKISGGVRTAAEAVQYYTIVKEVLGEEWLALEYFRIGASSLADNILKALL
ncbi:MAG: deoxyribose-phosphate aldolase [Candidatus Azobacteroides sp.]|nr:deoxyribose-phosphate aldolase [Candidatus Azobacteroides sp.]